MGISRFRRCETPPIGRRALHALCACLVLAAAGCNGEAADPSGRPAAGGEGSSDAEQGPSDLADGAGSEGEAAPGPPEASGDGTAAGDAITGQDGAGSNGEAALGPNGDPVPAAAPGGAATRVITNADQGALAHGFTVPAGEIWELDPAQNVSIEVDQNVIVNGVLRMRPSAPTIEHRLAFTSVDEDSFAGGGMAVIPGDVGLWVMDTGQLDIEGHARTGWTRLEGSAEQGSTVLSLESAPTGWRVGDELSIAPTAAGNDAFDQFDERAISAIDGATVTLDAPLEFDHPVVNGQWTAEVMNLTRNVQIEGGATTDAAPSTDGRAHILIHSGLPQHVKYAQIRYLGARTSGGRDGSDGVLGRYALHFHHSRDGSRGSIVEGVVVRNAGNHAFVPHASHGIIMRDNIAYDGYEHAFWWDPPENDEDTSNDTADLLWEHNIVALLHPATETRGYRLSAFMMATGTNLTVRDSTAVGVLGNVDANGFHWPEPNNHHPNNVWNFHDNIAHNNRADGIFVWQNDSNEHVVRNFAAYHNGDAGIDQGAYRNTYQYIDIQLYANGTAVSQHSSAGGGSRRADGYSLAFEGLETDGPLMLEGQVLDSNRPALYRNCSFSGVVVANGNDPNAGFYDFVDCNLQPDDFDFQDVASGTEIRVQNGADAFRLNDRGGVATIDPFYP